MHSCRAYLLSLSVLFLAACSPAFAAGTTYVKRSGESVLLGNETLEISFTTAKNQWMATRLVNKLSGRTIPIRCDEFSLGIEGQTPLRPADFACKQVLDEPIPGARRLVFHLDSAVRGVQLQVVYELGDSDFYVRRRLELSLKAPLPLRQCDVWHIGVPGKASHQGFGEPVFLEDTFWGLEFPAGHNSYAKGEVKLTQYPGRTVAERFTSKTAVLGVSEPGRVARRFQQYVESFRVTPKETALFVNYNTWWTLMPPTEKNCLELVDLFRRKLFEPYGESIDTFTLDDGWDDKNSLWSIRRDRFPQGFGPLVGSLKKINARLGIWLSPSSGYSHAPWLSTHGYEGNSNPWFCCQSGPNYRRGIVQRVTELAKQYDVAFFKFDGYSASCEASGHGHLPGPYAQEANVDAYIELLTAVRKTRPNIFLDPTCGIWLSPWWLRYADALWGSVSGDYPDLIVPAPILRDSATTTRDGVFRQRCHEHPGYPAAAIEHLGIIVITPEKWEDNAMIVAGRGCRLLTLYVNPKFYEKGDRDWAFLAALLKWVRHNAETLQNTELILGDPMKRDPYGYAHFRGAKGILALRNPHIEPQSIEVKLDESTGWSRPGAIGSAATAAGPEFVARIVYPRQETLGRTLRYGDTLQMKLQGYETAIVQLEPLAADQPVLLGLRCQETGRSGNRVTYAVYDRPGQNAPLALAGLTTPIKALINGQPARLPSLVLPASGQSQPCKVDGGRMVAEPAGNSWQLTGRTALEVPAGSQASVYLLCDPRTTLSGPLACTAKVNGSAVKVQAVLPPKRQEQTHTAHTWSWFSFPVPAGRSEVSVTLRPAKEGWSFARGEVGWWLWAEHPLVKSTLTLEFAKPLPAAVGQPLPLPIQMESEREILPIEPLRMFRVGTHWTKLDRPAVFLDETAPEEAVQDYGKLERNRSVWQKEMIIAGRKFARGLGAHANGRIVFDLASGRFKTFRALIGRDEHAGDGRVVFEVWLDGKRLFASGPMTRATPARPIEVDVAGGSVLELRSLDGGDGISGDHANWADAQLLR